jgi:hypothetical protein
MRAEKYTKSIVVTHSVSWAPFPRPQENTPSYTRGPYAALALTEEL